METLRSIIWMSSTHSRKHKFEHCLDSTGVVQLLRENEEKYNLNWDLQHDQEGLLKILVFEVDEGKTVFSNLRSNVSKCVELLMFIYFVLNNINLYLIF